MMEVYFYCSYEHSQAGFFMTRLDGEKLVPAPLDLLPGIAADFFSFDRFQVLWRDRSRENGSWLLPKPDGSFLGIRNLNGITSSGRSCTINLAFNAESEEITALQRIGLTIFGDFDAFRSMILRWFSIGGPCSYQINGAAFSDWLRECTGMNRLIPATDPEEPAIKLLPYMCRAEPAKLETEFLRLAVCTSSWKEIYKTMGHSLLWLRKPPNVLTLEEFGEAFTQRGALWIFRNEPYIEMRDD